MKNTVTIFFVIVASWVAAPYTMAQVTPETDSEKQTNDKIEIQAEQDENENIDYEELQLRLQQYARNPLDLNTATSEEFKDFGLLTDLQIEALLKHIEKHGRLITLEELQTIDAFDVKTIRDIEPYVYVGGSVDKVFMPFNKLVSESQKQLLIRTTHVLQRSSGYQSTEGLAPKYVGDPYGLYIRYRMAYSRKYSLGITAEKDAGEQFFKGTQKNGFDYYSFHFFVRDVWKLKSLAVGDYQLAYGQGLTLWTGLAFGKSNDVSTIVRSPQGITPYTSVNEMQFCRGIAAAFVVHKVQADLFFSRRKIDGNISEANTDSTDDGAGFSSIITSGLHRTVAELADKNAIVQTIAGAHVKYKVRHLELGATAASFHFDKELQRTIYPYNQFQFSGKSFLNTGADYKWVAGNKLFFGEVAYSANSDAWAMIHGAIVALDPKLNMSMVFRNYGRSFQNIASNALRESSNNNERGWLWGLSAKPLKGFTLSGYFDLFSFPWLRYTSDAPSHGFEYLAQLNFTPSKKMDAFFRFRHQLKQSNILAYLDKQPYLTNDDQKNYRFNFSFKATPNLTVRTRAEWVVVSSNNTSETGFVLLQDVMIKPMSKPLSLSIRYVLFETAGYASRIYTYENDIFGTFSIPAYYEKGSRYYLNARYKVRKGFDIFLRYANTLYTNRSTIGSGNDEISGPTKSDVRAALKFEF